MYSNPSDLPLLTNPVGIDAPIQGLQEELKAKLPWLQKSFGRAYVGRTVRASSGIYLYPALYTGASELYDGSPNDNLNSYSFFEVEGLYRSDNPESYGDSGTNNYEAPISLVVWGNLLKVNQTLDNPYPDQNFSQNLLQDLLVVIRKNYDFKVESIEDNLYSVFEPYTCRQDNPTMFYYPYFCFKIRMSGVWSEQCNISNL